MRTIFVLTVLITGAVTGWSQEVRTAQAKVQLGTAKTEEERAMRAVEERFMAQTDAWFDQGDYWLVSQVLEMHVELHPSSYELVTNLGWMYGNMEDGTNELRVYVEYRNRYPENPEAWYPEAEFYFRQRVFKPVVNILEPTIAMTPKPHANTYRILAMSYRRMGMHKDAVRVYDELLKIDPTDAAAKMNRERSLNDLKGGG